MKPTPATATMIPAYDRVPFQTDPGLGERARIGLLVLRTDQTIEAEARHVVSKLSGVALYQSRLFNDFQITRETLLAMGPLIPEAAALLPSEWEFGSIGYGCTSGAMVIGSHEVKNLVRKAHPRAEVSDPAAACVAALSSLAVKRLGILTPYGRAVNEAMADGFSAKGFNVTAFASFEEPDDNRVARIGPSAIAEAAIGLGRRDDVDGVVVCCTSLRTLKAIPDIEAATGKPATSSNHALLWHLLRLGGIDDAVNGLGRLYLTAIRPS